MSGILPEFVVSILTIATSIFVFVVGSAVLLVSILYVLDVTQT